MSLGLPKANVNITDKPTSLDWYKFFVRLVAFVENISNTTTIVNSPYNPVSTSTNYAASYGDLVEASASGGNISVTLPNPATYPGVPVVVAKTDATANIVTVVGTINGVANFQLLAQDEVLTVVSVTTGWRAI